MDVASAGGGVTPGMEPVMSADADGVVAGSVEFMPIGAGCPGMPGAVGTTGCRIGVSVGTTVRFEQQVPSGLSGRALVAGFMAVLLVAEVAGSALLPVLARV